MKRLPYIALAMIAIVAPSIVHSQMMSSGMYGAGPNGYDYMVGTWSCVNSMAPSAMGAPAEQTMTVSKSSGALFFHTTSKNLDVASYDVYVPKSKMWISPGVGSDGSYGSESTAQSGKMVVWTGSTYFPTAGKMVPTRDTYTNAATKYLDVGEAQIGGAWKAEYRITCTKS